MEDEPLGKEPESDGQQLDEDRAMAPHPALPILDDAALSHAHGVCPFLRGAEGPLAMPAGIAVEGQLCVAIGPPRAQSTSQQQLVCLRRAHADCPRYQRGALVPPERAARSTPVPRATLAAILVLVLSAGISLGYVIQRGGLDMPAAGPASTDGGLALATTPTPAATEAVETVPVATPEAPSAEPSGDPGPSDATPATPPVTSSPSPAAATPTPTPTARATPKPTVKPKPTATPRSDRYKLLVKCPDRDGCWIYTVRPGDNLFSIAKYFGHPLKTIYTWNPQYPDARLRTGAEIRMPPPTR